jgi:hypothetical protein
MSNLVLSFNARYTTASTTIISGITFDVSTSGETLTSQSSPTVTNIPSNFIRFDASKNYLVSGVFL